MNFAHERTELELYASLNRQPVQLLKSWCDVIPLPEIGNETAQVAKSSPDGAKK